MSRNKPKESTRKAYLNELCKIIYNTVKVNCDGELLAINKEGGLADRPLSIFKTPESMAGYRIRMCRLFELTFGCEDTIFDFEMNRDVALKNALEYFKEYGIDIQSILPSHMTINEAVLTGICSYVLPAIFGVSSTLKNADDDSSQGTDYNFSSERIDKVFHSQLHQFQSFLMLYSSFSESSIDIDEQECYYNPAFFNESEYKKGMPYSKYLGNCNYAIPFKIHEVIGFPPLFPIRIRFFIGLIVEKEKTKEDYFSSLVKGYSPIDSNHHNIPVYVSDKETNEILDSTQSLEYDLSEISLFDNTDMNTIYYLTCITQSLVESLYNNPQTHADLHNQILKKARSHIHEQTNKYSEIAVKKSWSIIKYVENILTRFKQLIAFDEYILGTLPNEQNGNSILSVFGIEKDEDLKLIINDWNDINKWRNVCISFDSAINTFAIFINCPKTIMEENGTDKTIENKEMKETILFMCQHLSNTILSSHIARIEAIISSPEFNKAIIEQENHIDCTEMVTPTGFVKKRIPYLVKTLKSAVQSYIEEINSLLSKQINQ